MEGPRKDDDLGAENRLSSDGEEHGERSDEADDEQEGLALMASFDSHDESIMEFTKAYDLQEYSREFRNAAILLRGDITPEELPDLDSHELNALRDETDHKWKQPRALYFAILMCSIGALEQGMAQTSMNGANLYYPKEFGVDSNSPHDTFVVGLVNCGIYLSAGFIGAGSSDTINNRLGRRGAICLGSSICVVANIAAALSWNWQTLVFFRALLGAGLGINNTSINVFSAECAPAYIRGGLAVSWQMSVAFGIFLGFVANVAVYNLASPWRWQLLFPALPPLPLALLIWLCPESPAWYIKHGQDYVKAYQSLRRLRNSDIQAAKDIYAAHLRSVANRPSKSTITFSRKLLQLFTIPRIRRATLATFVVMLSQQLCGINIIAFFSSTIFLDAGCTGFQALLASVVFGFINFVGAVPAIWSMDRLGRRALLLLTLPPMGLTMFISSLTFKLPEGNPARLVLLACTIYVFCALYINESCRTFILTCALDIHLAWVQSLARNYCAEVFPLSHREIGMSFSIWTASIFATIVSITFPSLLALLKAEGAFALYAGLNFVAVALVFLFVPETRMRSLEELDHVFSVRTRDFVAYNTTEDVPYLFKRHVLRQKDARRKDINGADEYRPLVQEEE